jgi:hypothetical protein
MLGIFHHLCIDRVSTGRWKRCRAKSGAYVNGQGRSSTATISFCLLTGLAFNSGSQNFHILDEHVQIINIKVIAFQELDHLLPDKTEHLIELIMVGWILALGSEDTLDGIGELLVLGLAAGWSVFDRDNTA